MASNLETFTAAQLWQLSDNSHRYELVSGELRMMSPAGQEHGKIAMRVGSKLDQHVGQHRLGVVYAAETGFMIGTNPDTVRAPDVAFISQSRLDEIGEFAGYWPGAPDLAVEVLSPNDTDRAVEEKSLAWLNAGSRQVWVVDPAQRTITVYHSAEDIRVLDVKSELTAEELLPGWTLSLSELFG
ncbi:MAG: Uma2 family endonuclease [Planctomycetota bacterium]|nr:Uma2 family endonuclease [Planctomycetota bacterium]